MVAAWPGVLRTSRAVSRGAVSVLAAWLGLQPSHVPVPGRRAVGWGGEWLPQEAPALGPKVGVQRGLVAPSCCACPPCLKPGMWGAPGDCCRKPPELCARMRVACTHTAPPPPVSALPGATPLGPRAVLSVGEPPS